MRKGLPAILALLIFAAWQYRRNRPVFFVVVGTLFATTAILVSDSQLPETVLKACALGWLVCMLVAAVFGIGELARYIRKSRDAPLTQGSKEQ
jgi:hypothetical protein